MWGLKFTFLGFGLKEKHGQQSTNGHGMGSLQKTRTNKTTPYHISYCQYYWLAPMTWVFYKELSYVHP